MKTSTKWRVVWSGHMPGAHNMAVDEAILRSVAKGGPPTLRFYGWEPPAISLGHLQKVQEELDVEACRSLGVDIVRRPTGGRAVLHDVEVTYSLAIRENNDLIPKGITESYRAISEGMVAGLTTLGLNAHMASLGRRGTSGNTKRVDDDGSKTAEKKRGAVRSRRYRLTVDIPDRRASSVVCFDAPSWYEVVVGEKKIIGSAQMRRSGVLLQHGSIPLELDADKLFACLRLPSSRVRERLKKSFLAKATSIRAALGRPASFMEVAEAIEGGLARTFGIQMIESALTAEEVRESRSLLRSKYGEPLDDMLHLGKAPKAGTM